MNKAFYFFGILFLSLVGTVFYFSFSGANKRSVAQSSLLSQKKYECELKAILENGESLLFEQRVVAHESLSALDEYGFKGVYFDLFNVGGFSFYSEREKLILKTELEEKGVLETKTFNSMPISQSLELEVEFSKEEKNYKAKSFSLGCKLLHHVHQK